MEKLKILFMSIFWAAFIKCVSMWFKAAWSFDLSLLFWFIFVCLCFLFLFIYLLLLLFWFISPEHTHVQWSHNAGLSVRVIDSPRRIKHWIDMTPDNTYYHSISSPELGNSLDTQGLIHNLFQSLWRWLHLWGCNEPRSKEIIVFCDFKNPTLRSKWNKG